MAPPSSLAPMTRSFEAVCVIEHVWVVCLITQLHWYHQ